MQKVLIITYYWPPAGGPGVQRWLKMSKYLPDYGFEPIILTVDEEQASYPLKDKSLIREVPNDMQVVRTKTKELFNLYKKTSGRSNIPYSGFASETNSPGFGQKVARFIRGNLLFPDPRKGWRPFALHRAKALIKDKGIKTIITTGPPHSTHLIGLDLKKETEVKWIADFRDPWTDIYYYEDFYPTALVRKLEASLEQKVLLNADVLTTASPGFGKLLAEKCGSSKKMVPITNGFDPDDFEKDITLEEGDRDELVLTYAGTLTEKYPLPTLLDAIRIGTQEQQAKITLRFIGRLDQVSQDLLKASELHCKIDMIGYVDHAEVINYLSEASHLLLFIPLMKGSEGIIPAKLFEYIGASKEIIAIGKRPSDVAQIVEDNSFGKFFTPEEDLTLSKWLYAENKTRIQVDGDVRNEFNRAHLTEKLADVIESLF